MTRVETARATAAPEQPLPGRLAAGLVFFSSGAVLVLEIVSLRLVAPYVGLTLQTSTAVIGAALAAIAFGAWAGGRLADVRSPRTLLGPALAISGISTLLVLPIVRYAGEGVRGQGAGAVLLLALMAVFVPAAVMSAVSPLVVKLQLASLAETGSVVGRYSAIGTLGAILATFITGFYLVAELRTSTILVWLGIGLTLAGLAVAVVLRQGQVGATAIGVLLALAGSTLLASSAPSACDRETEYHCATVVADPERPDGRRLLLDTLSHSYVDLADPTYLEFAYVKAFAAAAEAVRPPGSAVPLSALHVGGGGMTLPRYLDATRPGSTNRVLEIDGGVVELDRALLGFRTSDRLTVDVVDGRIGVEREPADSYDLVFGDAFGGLAVPWHLTTREYVEEIRRVLRPEGVYAANVIDYAPGRFLAAELATLREVFPYVELVGRPEVLAGSSAGGNYVILASESPLPMDRVGAALAARGEMIVAPPGTVAELAEGAPVLTDDFAPVDQLLTPVNTGRSSG